MKNYWLDKKNLKDSKLWSDFDIMAMFGRTLSEVNGDIMEANKLIEKLKLQKLEELKLQVLAANPSILGVPLK